MAMSTLPQRPAIGEPSLGSFLKCLEGVPPRDVVWITRPVGPARHFFDDESPLVEE